uniref:Ribonuclease H-like domain-containing protein n=1 Tax=Tanacetum cinerariifolium TaxID=118510 RepID=A0A6L2N331_TANCI|nr:ribonuclease H-like domain-containing protein [Tanacetum cinerariifolium]
MSAPNSIHNFDDEGVEDLVTLICKLDISDPLYLHPNDSNALTVVSIKLKRTKNYQVWSCAMLLALEGKNKMGFIDGSCRRLNTDEVLGKQWDMVNTIVLGWILNFISEELFMGQFFSKRTIHIWEELKQTYDKFLMGLDDYYMQIRSSILSKEILPDVRSDYATISSEESHRVASGSIVGSSQRNRAPAFVSNVPNRGVVQMGQSSNTAPRPNNFHYNKQGGGSSLVCENCGFNCHTIDRCFKTIGYLVDFRKRNLGKTHDWHYRLGHPAEPVLNVLKEMPSDDERVDPNLNSNNKSQSASSRSSESGRDANTVDLSVNFKNDAHSSDDIFSTQDEGVTTLKENVFSEGNLDQNLSSSSQGVQNVRISSRQSMFPRNYNDSVVDSKVKYGIEKYVSKSDYSLYTKSDKGVFLALLVYADDIIITGNNVSKIKKFKVFLKFKFVIKDLGKLKYFLDNEVIDTENGICLNQRKYVIELLSEYGMIACKPVNTPLMSKLIISNKATKKDPILDNVTDYQKLMGKLIYLTNTRPDISYVVLFESVYAFSFKISSQNSFQDIEIS